MPTHSTFTLTAPYSPAGDQPQAISALVQGINRGDRHQTLLGVTGSGKTFTIANVIAEIGKPTLVIAHNKTLAAQLTQEYREFFPGHAVHYFVSYYDYYQPEAYVPHSDTYIEKEAQINDEIDRLRHASTQALLTRRDVIIVASVSAIYGLGSPEEYEKVHKKISVGDMFERSAWVRALTDIQFERTNADLAPGMFRAIGPSLEIMPVNEVAVYRIGIQEGKVSAITKLDAVTRAVVGTIESLYVFPAKHYITPENERDRAIKDIEKELEARLLELTQEGKMLEAERLKRRTRYDIALIREIGYCNGIENYSRHFDGRKSGEPPYTLLSYFPHTKDGKPDFLTVIDESHVTVPQLGAMYAGDQSRKKTLVEYGFRLPSAKDNRPLTFEEFEGRVGATVYTSATPGTYELEHSSKVVEQIIRPTGLIDPEIVVKKVSGFGGAVGQVEDFIEETRTTVRGGGRVLATTLTKKMAEDLSEFLKQKNIKAEYLHSDVKTIDRITILTKFRKGEFDVLVGVNLLREGLDLPEVELVGILDADKEGFLRSETSLIQTIGRAARNVKGRVILYADEMTGSLEKAIAETARRRTIQIAYNTEHGITPQTIKKNIADITDTLQSERAKAVDLLLKVDLNQESLTPSHLRALIRDRKDAMEEAVKILDFETAAILRDEIYRLEESLGERKKKKTARRSRTII